VTAVAGNSHRLFFEPGSLTGVLPLSIAVERDALVVPSSPNIADCQLLNANWKAIQIGD